MSLTAFARLWYSLRPPMTWYRVHIKWANNGLAICLILILLALAPLAVAQDVHHELAAADADGHEHSDTDLCQWVQHHTSGSVDLDEPVSTAFEVVSSCELPVLSRLISVECPSVGPSRAPPRV